MRQVRVIDGTRRDTPHAACFSKGSGGLTSPTRLYLDGPIIIATTVRENPIGRTSSDDHIDGVPFIHYLQLTLGPAEQCFPYCARIRWPADISNAL
jgi:hypothetical protein